MLPPLPITRIALAWSRFALVTWLATWAASVGTLAVGGEVAAWQAWLGVGCGVLALRDRRLTRLQTVALVALTLLLSAAAVAFAVVLPDLTFDANLYHFPGAFALTDGWNPIRDRGDPVVAQSVSINAAEIVRCYPKGVWFWFAAVHEWAGNIDAGKALSCWLVLAPAGPAFAFFRTLARQPALLSAVATVLVCANPVAVTQLTTGYIDLHVGTLVTTLLFSALLAVGKRWRGAATLAAMASALLVGAKFTGLVYACVLAAVVVAWALWLRRLPRGCLGKTALAIAAGVLLSFDSYVLNTAAYGNPFFPAWQPDKQLTVLDSQAAPAFRQRNRVDKLVRALGAPQTDADVEFRVDPEIRIPFTEVRWKPSHDARFSGFGPVFWEALLIALLAAAARRRSASVAALAAVLATTLATDAGWWPRLAPQVWLLPILLVASAPPHRREVSRLRRVHAWAVLLLLAGNVAVVAAGAWGEARRASDWWCYRVLRLDTSPDASLTHEDVHRSFQRRLRELEQSNGIPPDMEPPRWHRPPSWSKRWRLGLGLDDGG